MGQIGGKGRYLRCIVVYTCSLVGNTPGDIVESPQDPPFVDQTCYLLPAPTVQRPDLLTAAPTAPPDVDCAAALDLVDQDPTINQMMASLVMQVVRRMVAGTCPFMALYLDMDVGTVTPSYASPEAAAKVAQANGNDVLREVFAPRGEEEDTRGRE